ncbi:hypothetical protein SDC9_92636 [bioreactor metagenome]|uniref:Uncharacterized protein n=1 Tax=bioreactor metagenome TaxID=1076179 RepID=A0A645A531_9ZZZZ
MIGIEDDAGPLRHVEQPVLRGGAERELHGVVVDRAHRGGRGHRGLEDRKHRVVIDDALNRGDHRVGRDFGTAGELRLRAQVEGIDQTVGRDRPLAGQQRLVLALAIDLEKCLVDVVEQRLGDGCGSRRGRIHGVGGDGGADNELAILRFGGCRATGSQNQRE